MIYATCLNKMFILSQTTIISTDFPVNIWVAPFVVYAFHSSTILQYQVYKRGLQTLHVFDLIFLISRNDRSDPKGLPEKKDHI